jgi:hypothetical protein
MLDGLEILAHDALGLDVQCDAGNVGLGQVDLGNDASVVPGDQWSILKMMLVWFQGINVAFLASIDGQGGQAKIKVE